MPRLAIDTSGPSLYLALKKGDEVYRVQCNEKNSHNEKLGSLYSELLRNAGITSGELASITVGEGPGSFTGLRIGLGFAKGLSHALGIPLRMQSSFAAAAWTVKEQGQLLVTLSDARRGEFFAAGFLRGKARNTNLLPPQVLTSEELIAWTESAKRDHQVEDVVIVMVHGELEHPLPYQSLLPECLATSLLELTTGDNLESYRVTSVSLATPSYVRAVAALSIAERQKLKDEKRIGEVGKLI